MDLTQKYSQGVFFDFKKTADGKVSNTNYNEYNLIGKVPMRSLYNFIANLELQPRLYTIENLSITTQDIKKTDTVDFNMNLRSFYNHFLKSRSESVLILSIILRMLIKYLLEYSNKM